MDSRKRQTSTVTPAQPGDFPLWFNTITRKYFFIPILPLAISLGSFVRAVFIRLWATLQYWSLGLAAFPRNWRETVCVIDARHLPELLPGAGPPESQ